MALKISVYVFDIDGTLTTGGQPISQRVGHALLDLAQENTLIFASARPIRDMLPMLPVELHHCLMIGCNGALVWQQGQLQASHDLKADLVRTLVERLRSLQIPYVLDGHWSFAVSKEPHPFHDYIRSLSPHEIDESELLAQGVIKLLVLSKTAETVVMAGVDEALYSLHYHEKEGFYDLTPPNTNKYYSLSRFVESQAYVALGNDQNDFIMLDHAQTAIFMGDKAVYPHADGYAAVDDVLLVLKQLHQQQKEEIT